MSGGAIKISIIVPIYNVEGYLELCIKSMIGQSYENLEIILVDDGSTDRCPEICDDYAQKDKRIHVIHKQNGGVVSARRVGAAAATGDYVLGVDGDDWIEKDRIEILVRDGIMLSRADMIYLSGFVMDFEEKGKESVRHNSDISTRLFEDEEIENVVFPMMAKREIIGALWMWAVRRELLLKNQMLIDDRIIYEEDSLCLNFCLLEANSVMMIQQGGYHYLQRAASIVHQRKSFYQNNPLIIWYQMMNEQLAQKRAPKKICDLCSRMAADLILRYYGYDYDWLLQVFPDYLFPFPAIGNGSRIVVYGAGKFGRRFVQSLGQVRRYFIVLWVDQNPNCSTVPGYTISSRDALFSVDYDFIVVAIKDSDVVKEVKRSLILDGVPEKKIATMNDGAVL